MICVLLAAGHNRTLEAEIKNDPGGKYNDLVGFPKALLPGGGPGHPAQGLRRLDGIALHARDSLGPFGRELELAGLLLNSRATHDLGIVDGHLL